MSVRVRNEDGIDHIVDAAGAAETKDIPVLDELRLADGKDEDPRFSGPLDDTEGVDVRAVLDTRGEAP